MTSIISLHHFPQHAKKIWVQRSFSTLTRLSTWSSVRITTLTITFQIQKKVQQKKLYNGWKRKNSQPFPMWGNGEEPQSSPPPTPIYRQYLILHCSIYKNLYLTFMCHPTNNWGSIWENIERWTRDLLTRAAVKLDCASEPGGFECIRAGIQGLICIRISQDKISIINFLFQRSQTEIFIFQFPRH